MDLDDIGKPQNIRLADVFVLGPLSIWFGVKAEEMPTWARAAMIAYGVGTIAYNGKNYLENEEARKLEESKTKSLSSAEEIA
jgi:hypothetical protein